MGSAPRKASWAVAAGVAAVEALKDQAGLCRWNYAMRSIHQHAKNNLASSRSSASASKVRKLGAVDHGRGGASEAARRAREVEKAENVVQLVCWGPN